MPGVPSGASGHRLDQPLMSEGNSPRLFWSRISRLLRARKGCATSGDTEQGWCGRRELPWPGLHAGVQQSFRRRQVCFAVGWHGSRACPLPCPTGHTPNHPPANSCADTRCPQGQLCALSGDTATGRRRDRQETDNKHGEKSTIRSFQTEMVL